VQWSVACNNIDRIRSCNLSSLPKYFYFHIISNLGSVVLHITNEWRLGFWRKDPWKKKSILQMREGTRCNTHTYLLASQGRRKEVDASSISNRSALPLGVALGVAFHNLSDFNLVLRDQNSFIQKKIASLPGTTSLLKSFAIAQIHGARWNENQSGTEKQIPSRGTAAVSRSYSPSSLHNWKPAAYYTCNEMYDPSLLTPKNPD
jgi:hypothetical protein